MIFTYKPVRSNVIVVTDVNQLKHYTAYELVETLRGHEDVKYLRVTNMGGQEVRFLTTNDPRCHYNDKTHKNWPLFSLKYVQNISPSGQLLVYRR